MIFIQVFDNKSLRFIFSVGLEEGFLFGVGLKGGFFVSGQHLGQSKLFLGFLLVELPNFFHILHGMYF